MPNILFIGRHLLVFITSCISFLEINKINLVQILLTIKVNTHHQHKISMTISKRDIIKTEDRDRSKINKFQFENDENATLCFYDVLTRISQFRLSFYTDQSKLVNWFHTFYIFILAHRIKEHIVLVHQYNTVTITVFILLHTLFRCHWLSFDNEWKNKNEYVFFLTQ